MPQRWVWLLPFSFEFFTRLAAVFTEEVGGFALKASADWPQYGGPEGRWVADAGDHQYLKDWSKARMVWTSETSEIGFVP